MTSIVLARTRGFRDHELNEIDENYASIVPVTIPDLDEIRKFATKLHVEGKPWKGEVLGWQAEYNPERPESPLDSKMTFTPADFCSGESGIWFFSLTWEQGKEAPPAPIIHGVFSERHRGKTLSWILAPRELSGPVEFLDDRNILARTVEVEAIAGAS